MLMLLYHIKVLHYTLYTGALVLYIINESVTFENIQCQILYTVLTFFAVV